MEKEDPSVLLVLEERRAELFEDQNGTPKEFMKKSPQPKIRMDVNGVDFCWDENKE